MAQRPKNNMPAAPGANPTGPLSILNSAGGVRYPTSPLPTQNAAGGGLMQLTSNPNPPMAYNMTPTYNNATSTPVPQSVLHYASGGSASTSAPGGGTPFDQLATDQQIQYLLSQNPGLQAQYPQQMPSVISPTNPIQAVSAAGGGMMYASGGLPNLGSYSDGGQLLKGPGDGMSDSIPASIAGKQPARLANDEFVVPADVVSHLGNGSSDAGAKKLYDMMDRVRRARTGKPKQAKAIHPERYMPG